MTVLLDTHVVLWWLTDDHRLPDRYRRTIQDPAMHVAVSAASAWEMSIKTAIGKLRMPPGLVDQLDRQGFGQIPVTVEDGLAAGALPRHHDDPFDRMLIAQAIRRDLRVLTVDPRFADYEVRLLGP